ncbi:MAG: signal peptide peptidase SppA [Henriciella sp.]
MRMFLSAFMGTIIGLVAGALILVGITMTVVGSLIDQTSAQPEQPDIMVLEIDMRDRLPDQAPKAGLEAAFGGGIGFIDTIISIERAAADDRVKGIFIRASEMGVGSSRAEEYRDVLAAFKRTGKFVITHSQGAFIGGPSSLRAISMSDEIWIQPGSDVIATGIGFETLFLGNLMKRLSISPDFVSLYEFKTAPNNLRESDYTDAHRESLTGIATELWAMTVESVAEDRQIDPLAVRETLESGPLGSRKLILTGLADIEGWPEDARDAALARAGPNSQILDVRNYVPPQSSASGPAVAIVGGRGGIVTGGSDDTLLQAGSAFASDSISAALFEAAENDRVKAIVFRVDTGGGSPTGSDQIWRSIERIKADYKKPVIISMGSMAASGGYYVSMGADWIVANPSSITGSIGITGGKIAISEGLARLGVDARTIAVGGDFTTAFMSSEKFTPSQREAVEDMLARGYDRFVQLVADGRNLTAEQIDRAARGRIWSGRAARDIGLVDELGGILQAVEAAKRLADLPEDQDISLIHYPRTIGLFGLPTGERTSVLSQISNLMRIVSYFSRDEVRQAIEAYGTSSQAPVQARISPVNER